MIRRPDRGSLLDIVIEQLFETKGRLKVGTGPQIVRQPHMLGNEAAHSAPMDCQNAVLPPVGFQSSSINTALPLPLAPSVTPFSVSRAAFFASFASSRPTVMNGLCVCTLGCEASNLTTPQHPLPTQE